MKKIITLSLIALFISCKPSPENTKLSGPVFGTTYSVVYDAETHFQKEFDSLFEVVNQSMSTYIPHSIISKVNRNETVKLDAHFIKVLTQSKQVYRYTEGAFDPTIGAVVNAWDFGPEGHITTIDSTAIDSLMKSVGLNRMGVVNNTLVKNAPEAYLDFNAIAKGYGVDVIADFLESKNVANYLVEIGGEIRSKGINMEKELPWKVGIETPHFDGSRDIMKTVELEDGGMATSGTYRKFKIDENGNRYSHIIDTKTGYPSKTNLLSISVMAKTCAEADAYATAFKAMGIEKVRAFSEQHPEIKSFLIFENDKGEFETVSLNGFPE